jgi:hypothetical protein
MVCGFGFERWCGSCLVVSSPETFFPLLLVSQSQLGCSDFFGGERG